MHLCPLRSLIHEYVNHLQYRASELAFFGSDREKREYNIGSTYPYAGHLHILNIVIQAGRPGGNDENCIHF